MTLEPPSGLKKNLERSYQALDDKELDDCKKPDAFKKLIFGFCFFHAIIQDRRKFGPIGWNIPYAFTNEDLDVCKKQLKMLLNEYEKIPFKVLNYLGGVINYGGRVTDDKDKRLIEKILETYINKEVLRDGYEFSSSGIYVSIPAGTLPGNYSSTVEVSWNDTVLNRSFGFLIQDELAGITEDNFSILVEESGTERLFAWAVESVVGESGAVASMVGCDWEISSNSAFKFSSILEKLAISSAVKSLTGSKIRPKGLVTFLPLLSNNLFPPRVVSSMAP